MLINCRYVDGHVMNELNSNVDKLKICMEHNITQKLISVVKQTPYQFTLQIEVTCGGIEPQFLKQKLYPL
jgi:dihydroorotase